MILKNLFNKLIETIKSIPGDREARLQEAAREIGRILFQEVATRQPIGLPDSWDLRTTASMRQGHTTIRDGWGEGPEVFSKSPEGAVVSLSNVSEHIQYFVWSIGGVRRSHLGTDPHRIPMAGYAKEEYGHPLAFWWQEEMRPEFRHSWVSHPGMSDLRSRETDFIEDAWVAVEKEALVIAREGAKRTAFDRLRKFW